MKQKEACYILASYKLRLLNLVKGSRLNRTANQNEAKGSMLHFSKLQIAPVKFGKRKQVKQPIRMKQKEACYILASYKLRLLNLVKGSMSNRTANQNEAKGSMLHFSKLQIAPVKFGKRKQVKQPIRMKQKEACYILASYKLCLLNLVKGSRLNSQSE